MMKNTKKAARTRKQTRACKQAATAKHTAAVMQENTERINARLSTLLSKHFPAVPLPVFPVADTATELAILVYIAAGIPFVRRDLAWNMEKAMKDAATQPRVDRNARLIKRLVFLGLVQRGELIRIK